ncbi:MAG: translation initiation factor IF-2 N-terminal domain-containing protein, partial [Bacillota bacterium]|nr:translation initiation factor IF-2 N-terminal domain-containing protein [Bacillota bacterium]
MAKVRVYELAKELNVNSKDLVVLLQKLGVEAKNHMSIIEESLAQRIRERVAALRSQTKPAAVQQREAKPELQQQVPAVPQRPARPAPAPPAQPAGTAQPAPGGTAPAARGTAERPPLRAIPGGRAPAQGRAEREGAPPRRAEYP